MSSKVLLISPPWRMPDSACLALGLLRPILAREGIEADTLHGTQLFPRSSTGPVFLSTYAAHLFAPHLEGGDADAALDALAARYLEDLDLGGLVLAGEERTLADFERDEVAMRRDLHEDIARAGVCVDRCVDHALEGGYDVVGFSVTFETQLPAALAIARRLKARHAEVKVMFGGSACFREPADALMASFSEIDAVCHCEGDQVIAPLVRALRGEGALADVRGIAWRGDDGTIHHNPSPPLLHDLDSLPIPEFDDFVEALAVSEWREAPPKIFFETSRGCWWGEKHLCSFCGLNAEGLPFRRKSPERALEEIRALHKKYPSSRRLQATDNILDMRYIKTLLPELAVFKAGEDGADLSIFFEVKPSFKKEHIQALAAAGIDLVQPGIESFHDDILKLMNKGNSALGQVMFIKWSVEHGVGLSYNLIVRNPGEVAAWYHEMTALVDIIDHLPPPSCVSSMWLERFSPYHNAPARHGISNVRAKPHYHSLCPALKVSVEQLAYVFDYDHEMFQDEALVAALHRFVRRVGVWQHYWRPETFFYQLDEDRVIITDRRGDFEKVTTLESDEAALFLRLDRPMLRAKLATLFPNLDPALLDAWRARRWLCEDPRGRVLSVIPLSR